MWTIFKVFVEFVIILFLFYVLVLFGHDVSAEGPHPSLPHPPPQQGWTCNPCIRRQTLYHWTASEVTQSFKKCKILGNMNEILPGKRKRGRKLEKGCLEVSMKKKYQTQGTYKL